ncbi:hypothetical protein H4219_004495, partial [Mycoemilia scoparia]
MVRHKHKKSTPRTTTTSLGKRKSQKHKKDDEGSDGDDYQTIPTFWPNKKQFRSTKKEDDESDDDGDDDEGVAAAAANQPETDSEKNEAEDIHNHHHHHHQAQPPQKQYTESSIDPSDIFQDHYDIIKALKSRGNEVMVQTFMKLRDHLKYLQTTFPNSTEKTGETVAVDNGNDNNNNNNNKEKYRRVVYSWLDSSKDLEDVFAAWDTQHQFSIARADVLILEVMSRILNFLDRPLATSAGNNSSSSSSNRTLGVQIIRVILRQSMKCVYRALSNVRSSACTQALRLLNTMARFGDGAMIVEIKENFKWDLKSLNAICNDRSGNGRCRQLWIRFVLAFFIDHSRNSSNTNTSSGEGGGGQDLQKSTTTTTIGSSSNGRLKTELLEIKDLVSGLFKGLCNDSYQLIDELLVAIYNHIVVDHSIRRVVKINHLLATNMVVGNLVKCLEKQEPEQVFVGAATSTNDSSKDGGKQKRSNISTFAVSGVVHKPLANANSDGEQEDASESIADLVQRFILAITTVPGIGLCYKDYGLYPAPRSWSSMDIFSETYNNSQSQSQQGAGDGQDSQALSKGSISESPPSTVPGNPNSSSSSSNYLCNHALLRVMTNNFKPTENKRQMDIVLAILRHVPELTAPYWKSQTCSFEPRLSLPYLINTSLAIKIMSLPLPIASRHDHQGQQQQQQQHNYGYYADIHEHTKSPPSLSTLIEHVLPTPLNQLVLTKGIQHKESPALIRYRTFQILSIAARKLDHVRNWIFSQAQKYQTQGQRHPRGSISEQWIKCFSRLLGVIKRKLPEWSTVVEAYQILPSLSQPTTTTKNDDGNDNGDCDEESQVQNYMFRLAILQVMTTYQTHFPESVAEYKFDVGKLLNEAYSGGLFDTALTTTTKQTESGGVSVLGRFKRLCLLSILKLLEVSPPTMIKWQSTTMSSSEGGGGGSVSHTLFGQILLLYLGSHVPQIQESSHRVALNALKSFGLFSSTSSNSHLATTTTTLGMGFGNSSKVNGGDDNDDGSEVDVWLQSLKFISQSVLSTTTTDDSSSSSSGKGGDQLGSQFLLSFESAVVKASKLPFRFFDRTSEYYDHDHLGHSQEQHISPLLSAVAESLLAKWISSIEKAAKNTTNQPSTTTANAAGIDYNALLAVNDMYNVAYINDVLIRLTHHYGHQIVPVLLRFLEIAPKQVFASRTTTIDKSSGSSSRSSNNTGKGNVVDTERIICERFEKSTLQIKAYLQRFVPSNSSSEDGGELVLCSKEKTIQDINSIIHPKDQQNCKGLAVDSVVLELWKLVMSVPVNQTSSTISQITEQLLLSITSSSSSIGKSMEPFYYSVTMLWLSIVDRSGTSNYSVWNDFDNLEKLINTTIESPKLLSLSSSSSLSCTWWIFMNILWTHLTVSNNIIEIFNSPNHYRLIRKLLLKYSGNNDNNFGASGGDSLIWTTTIVALSNLKLILYRLLRHTNSNIDQMPSNIDVVADEFEVSIVAVFSLLKSIISNHHNHQKSLGNPHQFMSNSYQQLKYLVHCVLSDFQNQNGDGDDGGELMDSKFLNLYLHNNQSKKAILLLLKSGSNSRAARIYNLIDHCWVDYARHSVQTLLNLPNYNNKLDELWISHPHHSRLYNQDQSSNLGAGLRSGMTIPDDIVSLWQRFSDRLITVFKSIPAPQPKSQFSSSSDSRHDHLLSIYHLMLPVLPINAVKQVLGIIKGWIKVAYDDQQEEERVFNIEPVWLIVLLESMNKISAHSDANDDLLDGDQITGSSKIVTNLFGDSESGFESESSESEGQDDENEDKIQDDSDEEEDDDVLDSKIQSKIFESWLNTNIHHSSPSSISRRQSLQQSRLYDVAILELLRTKYRKYLQVPVDSPAYVPSLVSNLLAGFTNQDINPITSSSAAAATTTAAANGDKRVKKSLVKIDQSANITTMLMEMTIGILEYLSKLSHNNSTNMDVVDSKLSILLLLISIDKNIRIKAASWIVNQQTKKGKLSLSILVKILKAVIDVCASTVSDKVGYGLLCWNVNAITTDPRTSDGGKEETDVVRDLVSLVGTQLFSLMIDGDNSIQGLASSLYSQQQFGGIVDLSTILHLVGLNLGYQSHDDNGDMIQKLVARSLRFVQSLEAEINDKNDDDNDDGMEVEDTEQNETDVNKNDVYREIQMYVQLYIYAISSIIDTTVVTKKSKTKHSSEYFNILGSCSKIVTWIANHHHSSVENQTLLERILATINSIYKLAYANHNVIISTVDDYEVVASSFYKTLSTQLSSQIESLVENNIFISQESFDSSNEPLSSTKEKATAVTTAFSSLFNTMFVETVSIQGLSTLRLSQDLPSHEIAATNNISWIDVLKSLLSCPGYLKSIYHPTFRNPLIALTATFWNLTKLQPESSLTYDQTGNILSVDQLESLFVSYGGTHSKSDKILLKIVNEYESMTGQSLAGLAFVFGPSAVKTVVKARFDRERFGIQRSDTCARDLVNADNAGRGVLCIDEQRLYDSVMNFYSMPLSKLSENVDNQNSGNGKNDSTGDIESLIIRSFNNSNSRQSPDDEEDEENNARLYDFDFLLPWTLQIFSYLPSLDLRSLINMGIGGIGVVCLSSTNEFYRKVGYTLMDHLYLSINSSNLREKSQLLSVLDPLKNAIPNRTATNYPRIPFVTTLFITTALVTTLRPEQTIYPLIQGFLLKSPVLDLSSIPLFYKALFSSAGQGSRRERNYLLRLAAAFGSAAYRLDYRLYNRRNVTDLLLTMVSSPITDVASAKSILGFLFNLTAGPSDITKSYHNSGEDNIGDDDDGDDGLFDRIEAKQTQMIMSWIHQQILLQVSSMRQQSANYLQSTCRTATQNYQGSEKSSSGGNKKHMQQRGSADLHLDRWLADCAVLLALVRLVARIVANSQTAKESQQQKPMFKAGWVCDSNNSSTVPHKLVSTLTILKDALDAFDPLIISKVSLSLPSSINSSQDIRQQKPPSSINHNNNSGGGGELSAKNSVVTNLVLSVSRTVTDTISLLWKMQLVVVPDNPTDTATATTILTNMPNLYFTLFNILKQVEPYIVLTTKSQISSSGSIRNDNNNDDPNSLEYIVGSKNADSLFTTQLSSSSSSYPQFATNSNNYKACISILSKISILVLQNRYNEIMKQKNISVRA